MKNKRVLVFLLNITLSVLFVNIDAQVTIGSGLRPNEGALLDLKQEGITTKGLGLPRVLLKEENKLTIGDNIIPDESSAWELHVGLVVYNTNKCLGKGGDGVYVWNGNLWQRLPVRDKYEGDALYQPNSYLVSPGTASVTIPVEKAFRIWEYYGSAEGKNRLPAELVEGELTPVLYWQDAPIILSQSSLSISGNSRTDVITVNLAGGTVEGNVVVALKDGSGNARWSWHIWVTDDPTTADLNGGGFSWMDRHLGATSATAGEVETMGLTYQWGRKDPFPMSQSWDRTESILQSGHGELATGVDKSLTNENPSQINLKNSISNPIGFIRKDTSSDWYKTFTSTEDPWSGRWNSTADGCLGKSPFDPCPDGWKVPVYGYDDAGKRISPWNGLVGSSGTYIQGKAKTWENFGVYPFPGQRSAADGEISKSSYSYIWTGTADGDTRAYSFYYGTLSLAQDHSMARGYGFSVRCVKE